MNVVALISEPCDTDAAQWQFDKVMAAIAYDCDISVVFLARGVEQLLTNQSWKSLEFYGIDNIYVIENGLNNSYLLNAKTTDNDTVKNLLARCDLVL